MDISNPFKFIGKGYVPHRKALALMNPYRWAYYFKVRSQRLKNGISDYDLWAGGEYVLEIISKIIKEQEKPEDSPKLNLVTMASDIDNYLEFIRTTKLRPYTDEYQKLDRELYKKATDAATEFVRNFDRFWI